MDVRALEFYLLASTLARTLGTVSDSIMNRSRRDSQPSTLIYLSSFAWTAIVRFRLTSIESGAGYTVDQQIDDTKRSLSLAWITRKSQWDLNGKAPRLSLDVLPVAMPRGQLHCWSSIFDEQAPGGD
ncbi:hypothetical protein PM082_004492 [Marasmius tenuissimus]|nr:hypothetical protein PM082_004492 [Marasmius tenuissimus]